MFEGIISDLLIKYLGGYIKNLNKDNFNIGILGGDVALEELEISEEALSALNLPFRIKKGVIGSLKLKVPWTNLKSEPVIVFVENVFLLVEPSHSYAEYDEAVENKREAESKRQRLANAELMKEFKDKGDDKAGETFTQRLITKIVDNVQVEVKNVHVRFEDFTTNKDAPFAFGLCVESLQLQSTDAQYNPTFRSDTVIYKLASLKNLSAYVDPISKPSELNTNQMMAFFAIQIGSGERQLDHHYLMTPVSAHLQIQINTSDAPSLEVPKVTAKLVIQDVHFQLEDLQYQTILKLVDEIGKYEQAKKYLKYRPKKSIKEGGASAWWGYAINAVRDEVRDNLHRTSWKFLDQRRKDRKAYVELYKRKQKPRWLKPLEKPEEAALQQYEVDLPFEDIIFFRSLADAELNAEAKHQQVIDEAKKDDPRRGGLLGWLIGPSSAEKEQEANAVQLTEAQKLALYSTIDYNEVFEEIQLPKEYVKFKLGVEIKSASFGLSTAPRGTTPIMLVSSVLRSIRANAIIRPDSFLLDLSIKDFAAEDLYTDKTQFRDIITRSSSSQSEVDLLQLVFEQGPIDKHADYIVNFNMQPLDVILYKPAWSKIAHFFSTPDHVDVTEIQTRAVATINQLSTQTRLQLEQTLRTKKTFDIQVSVAAPVIIIPENPAKKSSPLLVFDLGQLSAKSDLRDPNAVYSEGITPETDCYDKFDISLENVKILLVPDNTLEWRSRKTIQENKMYLVEDFTLNLKIEKSIVPTELSLTQLKLTGTLPQLKLDFSPGKAGQLVRLVSVLLGRGATPPRPPPVPQGRPRRQSISHVYHPEADPNASAIVEEEVSPSEAQRILFVATFTVADIKMSVASSDGTDVVLVCASNLVASLSKRSYDTSISLALTEFLLEDQSQKSDSKFRHLAITESSKKETKQDLVSIKIKQLDKQSPEYEGVDIIGDVVFGSLYFICNRETISALIQVFIDLDKELPQTQSVADPAASKEAKEKSVKAIRPVTPAKQTLKQNSSDHIKITLSMDTLGLRLNQDGEFIAEFAVQTLAVHVHIYEGLIHVKGSLRDLKIMDMNMTPTQEIASITRDSQDEPVLEFDFDRFNSTKKGYPGYDNSIQARVKSIKFIVMGKLLSQLTSYFTDEKIMKSLNQAAREKAQQARDLELEEVEMTISRTKLDIIIESPVVVLPRGDINSEALILGLGRARVTNEFKQGVPMDTLNISVTNVNATALVDVKGKLTSTQLIKNIDVEATIVRALDPTYTEIPQAKIRVKLTSVDIMISDAQLLLLTRVFNSNLRALLDIPSKISSGPTPQVAVQAADPNQVKVQFDFQLEKIALQISDQVSPIAAFNLNSIVATMTLKADTSMTANVTLKSVILSDSNPASKSVFKNLISYSDEKQQFQFNLKRDAKQNTQVEVILNSPVVYLVPEPVLAIKNLIEMGINTLQSSSPSTSQEAAQKLIDASHEMKDKDGVNETPGTFNLAVHVVDPRIFVLEDSTQESSRAIVVKAGFDVQYSKTVYDEAHRKTKDNETALLYEESANVDLKGLEIALTRASKTEEDLPIIQRFDGVVKYKGSNEEQKINIDLQPISLLFSYQDFKLLTSIITAYRPAATVERQEEVLAEQKRKEIAEIAIQQGGQHPSQKKEQLRVKCQCIMLTLINDYQGRNVPLTEVRISEVKATAVDWTSQFRASVNLIVNADYWNQTVIAYEPLVESWPFEIFVKRGKSPILSVEVNAPQQLGVNLSHSLVESLGNILETMRRDLYLPANDPILNRGNSFSPYYIVNQTGTTLSYQGPDGKSKQIPVNSENPMSSLVGARNLRLDTATAISSQLLKLTIGDMPVIGVPLDQVGSHVFDFSGESKMQKKVMCRVELRDSSKVLTVSSMTILQNNTDIPLEFCIFEGDKATEKPSQVLGPIEPSASIAVPLSAIAGSVGVRPAGGAHAFNTGSLLQLSAIPTSIEDMNPYNRLLVADGESFHCQASAKIEAVREYQKTVIHFNAPLVLENLIPYPIICQVYDSNQRVRPKEIGKGDVVSLYDISSMHNIEIAVSLLDFGDSKRAVVHKAPEDANKPVFNSSGLAEKIQFIDLKGDKHFMKVDSRITQTGGRMVSLMVPFWVMNKTELKIDCKYTGLIGDGPIVECAARGNQEKAMTDHIEAVTDEVPVIFSAPEAKLALGATQVVARSDKTKWSKSFGIDSAGTDGVLRLPLDDEKHVYDLGVSLRLAKGVYRLTKVIEFHPRYMLFNELEQPVFIRQLGSNEIIKLEPGEGKPIYKWINDGSEARQVCINTSDKTESAWSGQFSLEHLHDFAVKVGDKDPTKALLVRTIVTQREATMVIKFSKQPEETPPYVIDNDTSFPFKYAQKKSETGAVTTLTAEPGTKKVYTWDMPCQSHVLQVQVGDKVQEFNLDSIESYEPLQIEGKTVYVYTHAKSTTKVFCLTENKDKLLAETTTTESDEKAKIVTETFKIDFKLNVKSMGISVIDSEPKELLYIWGEDLRINFSESNLNQNFEVILGNLQVDNQLMNTPFPVLLSQTVEQAQPFLHLSGVRSMENTTLDYITYFSFLVQEMNVTVDDSFVFEMLKFGRSLPLAPLTHNNFGPPVPNFPMTVTSTSLEEKAKSYPAGIYYFTYSFYPGKMAPITRFQAREPFSSITFTNLKPMGGYSKIFFISEDGENFRKVDTLYYEPGKNNDQLERFTSSLAEFDNSSATQPFDGDRKTIKDTAALHVRQGLFKLFELNPLKVNLTFMLSGEDLYADSPLRLLEYLFGTTMASIDNAPIRLNALVLEDAFLRQDQLTQRLIQHYRSQAIRDLYAVLGSADFLGNPVGLFNQVGTGVKDFFYEPAQGLVKSPQDFGIGLAKGSLSLAKHTTFGLFNTVSKITGTTGKGLATLTLDDEYVRQRQQTAIKEKPAHVGEGLLYGAKGLGQGIFDGVTGLVTQPVKGAQKEGLLGFAKGVGKGLIGVGVKPVVGVTDLVTKTTEGIRNTTTILDKNRSRRRPPRFMEANKAIGSYSEKTSKGVYLLKTLEDGKHKDDTYVFHEEINDRTVMLSDNAVYSVDKNGKLQWTLSYQNVTEIDLAKQGILIKTDREGPQSSVLIASPQDRDSTLRLYTKLEACVQIYYENHPDQKQPQPKAEQQTSQVQVPPQTQAQVSSQQ